MKKLCKFVLIFSAAAITSIGTVNAFAQSQDLKPWQIAAQERKAQAAAKNLKPWQIAAQKRKEQAAAKNLKPWQIAAQKRKEQAAAKNLKPWQIAAQKRKEQAAAKNLKPWQIAAQKRKEQAAAKNLKPWQIAAQKRKEQEAAKSLKPWQIAALKRKEQEAANKTPATPSRPAPTPGAATGSVSLAWVIPGKRENGKTLRVSDLNRYEIYYTSNSGQSETIRFNNPAKNTLTITNLRADTYYFAMAAVDQDGIFSELSNQTEKAVR